MIVERSITVHCRTNNDIQILVHIDQDNNVHHTTRRPKRNGEFVDYNHLPSLPAKRWWGMYIAEVHPKDRTELHAFLGLSVPRSTAYGIGGSDTSPTNNKESK